MRLGVRLVVASCPARRPIQAIWRACQEAHWPDCPFPIDVLSPTPDLGWNANLIRYLDTIAEPLVLLMLDDHFLAQTDAGELTANVGQAVRLMETHPDFALVKLQAGNAWPPELAFPEWDRLREYDRAHHPFKRTNLVPTLFRRIWLLRLSRLVLGLCGPVKDQGRQGAIELEVEGTRLTEDAIAWPERMLGIHREETDGWIGRSLLDCISSDAVREGHLKPMVPEDQAALDRATGGVARIPGIRAFL